MSWNENICQPSDSFGKDKGPHAASAHTTSPPPQPANFADIQVFGKVSD